MADYLYNSVQAAVKSGLLSGTIDGVRYERINPSENGTVVPPAYQVTDSQGGQWSLGNEYAYKRDGYLEFNVIRNDVDMGVVAERIEVKDGKIWIYGSDGWRHWSYHGNAFV